MELLRHHLTGSELKKSRIQAHNQSAKKGWTALAAAYKLFRRIVVVETDPVELFCCSIEASTEVEGQIYQL